MTRQLSPAPPGARPNAAPPLISHAAQSPAPWGTQTNVVTMPIQASPYPQGSAAPIAASPYPVQMQRELSPGPRPGPVFARTPQAVQNYYPSPAPQFQQQRQPLGMTPQVPYALLHVDCPVAILDHIPAPSQAQGGFRSTSAPAVPRNFAQGATPRGRPMYRGVSSSPYPQQQQQQQQRFGSQRGYSQSPMPRQQGPGMCGLGVTLRNDRNGDLRVVEIAPGGPASRQGTLRRGDIITSVNGINVRGVSVIQARDYIMGAENTPCQVGAYREQHLDPAGMGGQLNLTIFRGRTSGSMPGRASMSPMPQQQMHGRMPQQQTQSPYRGTPGSVGIQRPAVVRQLNPGGHMPVNEAMCGIGAFIERGDHGHLVIKNLTPEGPAAVARDVYPGDFIVGIDGGGTQGMSMMQVSPAMEFETINTRLQSCNSPFCFCSLTQPRTLRVILCHFAANAKRSSMQLLCPLSTPDALDRLNLCETAAKQGHWQERYTSHAVAAEAHAGCVRAPTIPPTSSPTLSWCASGVLLCVLAVGPPSCANLCSLPPMFDLELTTLWIHPSCCSQGQNVLSHIFDVSITREPPKQPAPQTPQQPQQSYPPQGTFNSFPGHSAPAQDHMSEPYGDQQTITRYNISQSAQPYSSQPPPPLLHQQMPMNQTHQAMAQTPQAMGQQQQQQYQSFGTPQVDPYSGGVGAINQSIDVPPGAKCGIGIELIEFDGALIVQKVYPNGPAERSGLVMKGDLLHRLDYRTVSEMSKDTVRPMLFGDRGSSIVLGLIKPKFRLRVNVRLQREYVAEESIKAGYGGAAQPPSSAASQPQQPQQMIYRSTGDVPGVYSTVDGISSGQPQQADYSVQGYQAGAYTPGPNFETVMSDFDGPPGSTAATSPRSIASFQQGQAQQQQQSFPKVTPNLPRVSGPDVVL
jgi:C-terminal processing protease CtpA/Prc